MATRPNFLLVLTDDQDAVLGGLQPMVKTKRTLVDRGVTFVNAFVATPLCCPSRASLLTGLYPQRSLVTANSLEHGCASSAWVEGPEQRTLAVQLQREGYRTGFSGKYLNQYAMPGSPGCAAFLSNGCGRVPPGWDDWFALQGNARYYNGRVSDNGQMLSFGEAPSDYLPEVFFQRTRSFVAAQLHSNHSRRPFFAVLATPVCHSATLQQPAEAAPAHAGRFRGARAPRTPNYNASAASKHWLMRRSPPLSTATAALVDALHAARLASLVSLDEHVAALLALLRTRDPRLLSTYVVLTSDHGFQMGQHRRPADKRQPYEHNIRVPLLLAGPAGTPGARVEALVVSIDLAPSILHLATGRRPSGMDGRSFAPLLAAGQPKVPPRRDFLVSYQGEGIAPCGMASCWCEWERRGAAKRADCATPAARRALARGAVVRSGARHLLDAANNTFECVRTLGEGEDALYCEFDDAERFVELYDHRTDPWQLRNLAESPAAASVRSRYAMRLRGLRGSKAAPVY